MLDRMDAATRMEAWLDVKIDAAAQPFTRST
jgi:hypothetical protein